MRERKEGEPNRAFFEFVSAAVITGLLMLIAFVAKSATADMIGANGVLRALASFPLHGLLMLVLFGYIAHRERGEKGLFDWIKAGGATVVGVLTLLASLCVFLITYLLGAFIRMFGGTLTWHTAGVIGIVAAGVLTIALFFLYWFKQKRARYSLYVNRGLIFLLAACFCVWVFTFGHYMHERYIFPALFLLIFAYAYDRDPGKLAAVCMLSVTTFMNEMMAMFVVSDGAKDLIRGGAIHNQLIAVISLLEFCAAMYLTAVVFRKALAFDPSDPTGVEAEEKPLRKKNGGRR